MNVAFVTSVVAAKPNQTKREIEVLGQNTLWGRRNDIYVACKFQLDCVFWSSEKDIG